MIWAIGDIHGMLDPLTRLISKITWYHTKIEQDLEKIIFLGDYIDHGPSSKQVIDYIAELPFEKELIMGNHEDLLLQFVKQADLFRRFGNVWFRGNGGQRTANSFNPGLNVDEEREDTTPEELNLDDKYIDFFNNLKLSHVETIGSRKFVFVHALFNQNFSVSEQMALKGYDDFHEWRTKNMVWIEDTLIWDRTHPKDHFDDYIVIHGHIPTPRLNEIWSDIDDYDPASEFPFIKVKHHPDKKKASFKYESLQHTHLTTADLDDVIAINVDTGSVYGHSLTAIGISEEDLENNEMTVLKVHGGKGYRKSYDFDSFNIRFSSKIY